MLKNKLIICILLSCMPFLSFAEDKAAKDAAADQAPNDTRYLPGYDYSFGVPAMPGELDTIQLKNYNPDLDKDIVYTAAFGRADDISILLGRGANPNARNRNGLPALSIAADRKDPEAFRIVQVLVEAGAFIDATDADNNYPIVNAIKNHRTDIIEYLISKRASIAVTDLNGNTLVQIANKNKYKEVEDLIDARIKQIEKELAARKSRENMDKLAKDVLRNTCLGQFNEYVGKRNAKLSTEEQKARLEAAKRYKKLAELRATELMDIFHFKTEELDIMINRTNTRLVEDLDFLGARKSEGSYGSQEYMLRKCNSLVDLWRIRNPEEKISKDKKDEHSQPN